MKPRLLLPLLLCTVVSASTTLIDLLSLSPAHSLLVRAIQRARLVPLINGLNGTGTMLAPTDEAIRREVEKEQQLQAEDGVWTWALSTGDGHQLEDELQHDNLQLALRDTILYHLFNYTLWKPPPPPSNFSLSSSAPTTELPLDLPQLHETLYIPSLSSFNKSFPTPPSLPGSPPSDPPSKPERGRIEGMLKGEGQRVRLVRKEGKESKEGTTWAGTDWEGEGGARLAKEKRWSSRGELLWSLDGVLQKPKDLATEIRQDPSLSTLASLLPESLLDYISTAPHLTLFAPTNEAWGALSELEMRYLRSGFAEMDLAEIFGDGASYEGRGGGKVGYLSSLLEKEKKDGAGEAVVKTVWNHTLSVTAGENGAGAAINGTDLSSADGLAFNGVLHTLPTLLLPSGSLSLTAEKYLIALNCTRFVALLRSVNLSHYVQVPSRTSHSTELKFEGGGRQSVFAGEDEAEEKEAYTILAPRDDVLDAHYLRSLLLSSASSDSVSELSAPTSLPAPGSSELRHLLLYHLLHGRFSISSLADGQLVGTELKEEQKLRGGRQRVAVSVQNEEGEGEEEDDGGIFGGWKEGRKERKKGKVLGFAGASVVADPVPIGDSIIYLISSVLEPPTSVITTAVSDLRLSTFIASVYAASLDHLLLRQPAVTYLIPSNAAFAQTGLVMSYLLLPLARSELRQLVRYHAIDGVVYLGDFPLAGDGVKRYPTLERGSEVLVERESGNGTLRVRGPTAGGKAVNGERRDARVVEGDLLTDTGVIHIIDQVELPPQMEITIPKLLLGGKANTFVDLLRAANMTWVLDGSSPPSPPSDDNDEDEDEDDDEKRKDSSPPAYTILCPTDKALSRLNLTYYLSQPASLLSLVQLHVIPLPASPSSPAQTTATSSSNAEGLPLPLDDSITYSTLLDRSLGGQGVSSAYGKIAFRRWGDDGTWLVGIKGARGTAGLSDSARVVGFGRATPSLRGEERQEGGGVLLIDSVLLPFEPSWWRRLWWLWIVLGCVVLVGVAGCLGWRWWRKRKGREHYEPLETEED